MIDANIVIHDWFALYMIPIESGRGKQNRERHSTPGKRSRNRVVIGRHH